VIHYGLILNFYSAIITSVVQ